MNLKMQRLSQYLTYAGAIPFVLCAICFTLNIYSAPILGNLDVIFSVYALVITSFMAGSYWGQHLHLNNKWRFYLPIVSNVIAITLWIGFLVLPFKLLLITFIIAFLILLGIDKKFFQQELISRQYFRTRFFVTAIVISTLIIAEIYA